MTSGVVVALRNARGSCALASSVRSSLAHAGFWPEPNQSRASSSMFTQLFRRKRNQSLAPPALLYLANDADNIQQRFDVGDPVFINYLAVARDKWQVTKVLTVHPRSQHALAESEQTKHAYLLHVFCDDELLVEAPTDHTEKIEKTEDGHYSYNVAQTIIHWLGEEGSLSSAIRSGTHINMTRGLKGKVISGVITGGTKAPLGSVI